MGIITAECDECGLVIPISKATVDFDDFIRCEKCHLTYEINYLVAWNKNKVEFVRETILTKVEENYLKIDRLQRKLDLIGEQT